MSHLLEQTERRRGRVKGTGGGFPGAAHQGKCRMSKKLTFLVYDETIGGQVITGDIEHTLDYIKSYLAEMADNEEITFEVYRHDMTEEEMEIAPVVW